MRPVCAADYYQKPFATTSFEAAVSSSTARRKIDDAVELKSANDCRDCCTWSALVRRRPVD